jgi:protein-S-isoprenylcysteine O-methyltransferase Ste14
MNIDELMIRRALVLASVLIYWGGVWVQARRVRRHIGRTPSVAPHGLKERVLWAGWSLVVLGWMALAFVIQPATSIVLLQLQTALLHPAGLAVGVALVVAGYAGTLWCYSAMGDHWRMGLDHQDTNALVTNGPYSVVRHPIYLFQMLMLAGATALLPSPLPVLILLVHLACVWVKATDEEAHLTRLHGDIYRAYQARTGRLLPPLGRHRSP